MECRRFWDDADDVLTSRITYVETAAALAQAGRAGRLTSAQYTRCRDKLEQLWVEVGIYQSAECRSTA